MEKTGESGRNPVERDASKSAQNVEQCVAFDSLDPLAEPAPPGSGSTREPLCHSALMSPESRICVRDISQAASALQLFVPTRTMNMQDECREETCAPATGGPQNHNPRLEHVRRGKHPNIIRNSCSWIRRERVCRALAK